MNTTWWRTHPVAHRLLAVLVLEIVLLAVPGRGIGALLWLAISVWLVHLVRRSNGIAWVVFLGLSALTAALAVVSLVTLGFGGPPVALAVLNLAVVGVLLTPTVRGWVGRSGLMSLPGEH